jgi:hypothetical protein
MPKRFIDGQPAFFPVDIRRSIMEDVDARQQTKFWLIQDSNAEIRRV